MILTHGRIAPPGQSRPIFSTGAAMSPHRSSRPVPRHTARLLLSLLALLLAPAALAQPDLSRRTGTTVADTGAPGYRFESFRLSSADGQRHYRVRVAIPLASPPAGGFPSAFLLDGNAALMEVDAGLLATLADAPRPPVVAFIAYDDDLRINAEGRAFDYTPRRPGGDAAQVDALRGRRTGGADPFLALVTGEVLLRTAALAPLDPQRQALWGHSYGGLFVLHVLFTRPATFDRYVAVDPSLWWGDGLLLKEEARAGTPPPGVAVRILAGEGARTPSPHRAKPDAGGGHDGDAVRRARAAAPPDATRQLVERLRDTGVDADYRPLHGLSHGDTLGASLPIMLREIAGLEDEAPRGEPNVSQPAAPER